jgi:hypothetical protein
MWVAPTDLPTAASHPFYADTMGRPSLLTHGFRTYISEPDRGVQSWTDQEDARDAVYGNRRRIRGNRGQRLQSRTGHATARRRGTLDLTADYADSRRLFLAEPPV